MVKASKPQIVALGHAVIVGAVLASPVSYAIMMTLADKLTWVGGSIIPWIVPLLSLIPPSIVIGPALAAVAWGTRQECEVAAIEGVVALVIAGGVFGMTALGILALSII